MFISRTRFSLTLQLLCGSMINIVESTRDGSAFMSRLIAHHAGRKLLFGNSLQLKPDVSVTLEQYLCESFPELVNQDSSYLDKCDVTVQI